MVKAKKNRRRAFFPLLPYSAEIFLLHSEIICRFLFKKWILIPLGFANCNNFFLLKVSYNFIDFFVRKVWTKSDDIRCNLFLHFSKKMQIFSLCLPPLPLKSWKTGAKCVFFIILAFLQTKISIEYLSFLCPPIIITNVSLLFTKKPIFCTSL